MDPNLRRGKGLRGLIRRLCFMAIGAGAFANPLDILNPYYIGFGMLTGLIFGWLFRKFLQGFLSMLNGNLKKDKGYEAIRYAVDNGMMFLVPFTIMLLIAVYYLGWSMIIPFITAGIMAVGTASSIETGKLLGKPEIKNTIATSAVSFVFSFTWTLAFPYIYRIPPFIEGGVTLLLSYLEGGGFFGGGGL